MYSIKKDFFKNFAKFTEKHLRRSLYFDKVAGLRQATTNILSGELCDIFNTTRNFYRTLLGDCFRTYYERKNIHTNLGDT